MATPTTLEEYLAGLRVCEDPDRLRKAFHVYDNYPVLLYGDAHQLFQQLMDAFRNSPQSDGIRDSWHFTSGGLNGVQIFYNAPENAQVFIRESPHRMYLEKEHKINGVDHSMYVMFHPLNALTLPGGKWLLPLASAIAGFGDYVIRAGLTARFPYEGLDINHIPN